MIKNLLRIIGPLLLMLALQGCSTIRLAYNQAPLAAYWYLDDYLDFDEQQRPAMKAALADVHQWHRRTQLPAYLETLQKIQRRIPDAVTSSQACELYAEVQDRLQASVEGTIGLAQAPGAAAHMAVLATLDRPQLAHLEKQFAKSNAKYRSDHMSGSARHLSEKRLERFVSRAEMLYGKLEPRQEALLKARLEQSGFNPELAYAERLRRQQDVLQTLHALVPLSASGTASHTTAVALEPGKGGANSLGPGKSLQALVARLSQSPDARYRDYAQTLREKNCQTFADLHNTTSLAQRQKALSKLQGYEQDLQAVMRHP